MLGISNVSFGLPASGREVLNSVFLYHCTQAGLDAGVKGLIVMLLGGLGNVFGAMVAGLMLGMIEILSAAYIGTTERDLFSFLILILILIYKPTGLFGTRTADER